jgi:hypothetical protein
LSTGFFGKSLLYAKKAIFEAAKSGWEKGMILSEKQGRRIVTGRIWSYIACVLAIFSSLFTLPGCGGPSKEETAKQDEQGKKTNDEGMKRMMQEQGKPVGTPNAGGQ